MLYLRIINAIIALAVAFALPVVLLVSAGSTARLAFTAALALYVLASLWFTFWGKSNRQTAITTGAVLLTLLLTGIWAIQSDREQREADCEYTRTKCAALDSSGLYYCGASTDREGSIIVTHVEPSCKPTKEDSCAYAKQFCTALSTSNTPPTLYRCDHETITCP